jgi:hypothetical protein
MRLVGSFVGAPPIAPRPHCHPLCSPKANVVLVSHAPATLRRVASERPSGWCRIRCETCPRSDAGLSRGGWRPSCQQFVDQFDQLRFVDGFGEVGLGALAQSPHFVGHLIFGGYQHDWNVRRGGIFGD